jgi:hypothetical protein
MRGNPLVNLAAILVMLASVLIGGGYWLINKQEQSREVLQLPEKVNKKPLTFEKAVKETKE